MKVKRFMAWQNRGVRGRTALSPVIAFAQAIFKRYAASRGSLISAWRILDLVLRRARPGTTLLQVFRYDHRYSEASGHDSFYYAPRISLTVSQWGQRHGGAPPPIARSGEQSISRRYPAEARVIAAKQILSRLATRRERVEEWPGARRGQMRRATPIRLETEGGLHPAVSVDRPPTRIFRRLAPREVEITPPPATLEARSEKQGVVAIKRDGNRRPVDAPIDISRLTDQVIQAIDRRIVARRERTGRL